MARELGIDNLRFAGVAQDDVFGTTVDSFANPISANISHIAVYTDADVYVSITDVALLSLPSTAGQLVKAITGTNSRQPTFIKVAAGIPLVCNVVSLSGSANVRIEEFTY